MKRARQPPGETEGRRSQPAERRLPGRGSRRDPRVPASRSAGGSRTTRSPASRPERTSTETVPAAAAGPDVAQRHALRRPRRPRRARGLRARRRPRVRDEQLRRGGAREDARARRSRPAAPRPRGRSTRTVRRRVAGSTAPTISATRPVTVRPPSDDLEDVADRERARPPSSPGAASTRRPVAEARRTSGRPGAARSPGETIFSTTMASKGAVSAACARSVSARRRPRRAPTRPRRARPASSCLARSSSTRGRGPALSSLSKRARFFRASSSEACADSSAARAPFERAVGLARFEADEDRSRAHGLVPGRPGPPRPEPRAGSRGPPRGRPTTTPSTSTRPAASGLDAPWPSQSSRGGARRVRAASLLRAAGRDERGGERRRSSRSSSFFSLPEAGPERASACASADGALGLRAGDAQPRAQLGGAGLEQVGEARRPFLVARLLDLAGLARRRSRPRRTRPGAPPRPSSAARAEAILVSAPRGVTPRPTPRPRARPRALRRRASRSPPDAKRGTRTPPKMDAESPQRPPGRGACTS